MPIPLLALAVSLLLIGPATAMAEPVIVRFTEGLMRGFPVLRTPVGTRLAQGDLSQVAHDDRVTSRLTFRFLDGSIYDETAVFTQRGVFTLQSYRLVQRGPSFPETIDAELDRERGTFTVHHRADSESPPEHVSGPLQLPADVYNGMLVVLMKNLLPAERTVVRLAVFTPRPRFVKIALTPAGQEPVAVGNLSVPTTRYLVQPQLGPLAAFLIAGVPEIQIWIAGGDAPAFVRFLGPLDFLGPVWRIETQ